MADRSSHGHLKPREGPVAKKIGPSPQHSAEELEVLMKEGEALRVLSIIEPGYLFNCHLAGKEDPVALEAALKFYRPQV